jgi:hypothetical protein
MWRCVVEDELAFSGRLVTTRTPCADRLASSPLSDEERDGVLRFEQGGGCAGGRLKPVDQVVLRQSE